LIAIVDCNSFYASCERVFRPDLDGKPIVVLSNNDGCVIARSAEAKKYQIPMAAPAFKFEHIFKHYGINVFSSNYALYGDLSNRVMNILSDMSPETEVYSIDEAFLNLDGIPDGDLRDHCLKMKKRVRQWVGIPISTGVAPTKTLAKVANKIAKKYPQLNGVHIIDSEDLRIKALKFLPVGDLWGIGRRHKERLIKLGVKNAYQFTLLPEEWVKKNMTVVGLRLLKELKGQRMHDFELVAPKKKAIAITRSFPKTTFDIETLQENISIYASVCGEKLRKQGSDANVMQVFLRTSRFKDPAEQRAVQLTVDLEYPTNSSMELASYAQRMMDRLYKDGYGYGKAGVITMGLTPTANRQATMFSESNPKHVVAMEAMDRYNRKDAAGAIRLASNGTGKRWRMRQEKLSPRYTTRIDDCITVKAS